MPPAASGHSPDAAGDRRLIGEDVDTADIVDTGDLAQVVERLHPLECGVLRHLLDGDASATWTEETLGLTAAMAPAQVTMALGWLQTKGLVAIAAEHTVELVRLTESVVRYSTQMIPPLQIVALIRQKTSVPIRELQADTSRTPDETSDAIGALKKSGAVRIVAGAMEISDESRLAPFEALQQIIQSFTTNDATPSTERGWVAMTDIPDAAQEIVRRHHHRRNQADGIFQVKTETHRTYRLTQQGREIPQTSLAGRQRDLAMGELLGALTPAMLRTGAWQGTGRAFRKYDITLPVSRVQGGRRHPYQRFLDRVKQKFVAMGFAQMRGPLVESEFWNMDALFMPQFHPARAIHDVYFVRGLPTDDTIQNDQIARVAAAHENGGATGSRGWRYSFDAARTRRLVLRSQGTAVSARTLGGQPAIPGKYFSIARCFRYDAVDATHAPDFFQVEGIVLGSEIRFTTLLGLLTLFAKEMAQAAEIQFRPAYFPFTEPSVEMHVRHPTLGWMELGGAGLLRPEVTGPLGIDVPVIAWGLGLDRMAMMALKLSDIRDLFSADLAAIRNMPDPLFSTAA